MYLYSSISHFCVFSPFLLLYSSLKGQSHKFSTSSFFKTLNRNANEADGSYAVISTGLMLLYVEWSDLAETT
jgi:hypothetical protein